MKKNEYQNLQLSFSLFSNLNERRAPLERRSPPERFFARTAVTVSRLGLYQSVTEKQVSRLYAIAFENHWSRREVSAWMEKWFRKRDAAELTRFEYDKICDLLLTRKPKSELQRSA